MMQELFVRDLDSGKILGVVQNYQSLQWTRRAQAPGGFVLKGHDAADFSLLQPGRVLQLGASTECMLIETVRRVDRASSEISCAGPSILAVLDWRAVVVNPVDAPPTITGTAQEVIHILLQHNAILPTDPARKIPGLTYAPAPGLPVAVIRKSVSWKPLLNAVTEVAQENNIGLRALFSGGGVQIQPYPLTDNPRVLSRNWETVTEEERLLSEQGFANFIYVCGEGDYPDRAIATAGAAVSGYARRECSYNASGVNSSGAGDYPALLAAVGEQQLAQRPRLDAYTAGINTRVLKYRTDYNVGQYITVVNQNWGVSARALIAEATETYDKSGLAVDVVLGERTDFRKDA